MLMAPKREIKTIINSKKLTGKEAARLLLRHLVETDHHRPRVLTDSEIQQLRSTVSRLSEKDVEDFNSWMELYRVIGFTLAQAEVLHLEILLDLSRIVNRLQPFIADGRLRSMAALVPTCVTEKQWQELQASQRERKLEELHCLAEVISKRAMWRSDSEEPEEEFTKKEWSQAAKEVAGILASHKLQPLELEECADTTEREDIAWWPRRQGEPADFSRYLTGQQLYETGLPEWQAWIDNYQTLLYGDSVGNSSNEVAVVLQPAKYHLDERGWYKEFWPEVFSELNMIATVAEKHGLDIRQSIRTHHTTIRKKIRVLLAHQPALEAISDLTGVKLHEDLEVWLATVQEEVAHYQSLLGRPELQQLPPALRGGLSEKARKREALRPDLPAFTMEDLKPDPKQLQHLKERMALALTAEDYYQAFDGWMEERCREIDATECLLAEEVAEDGDKA